MRLVFTRFVVVGYIINYTQDPVVVDPLITGSPVFIEANIGGMYILLKEAYKYWAQLKKTSKANFCFHYISSDEIYDDLPYPGDVPTVTQLSLFTEKTFYSPGCPQFSSKASSDFHVWCLTAAIMRWRLIIQRTTVRIISPNNSFR